MSFTFIKYFVLAEKNPAFHIASGTFARKLTSFFIIYFTILYH